MFTFTHTLRVGDCFRLIGRDEWFRVTKLYLAAGDIPSVIGQNDRHQTVARVADIIGENAI